MCGGIIAALTLGLPADIRNSRFRMTNIVLAYSIGRIGSYSLAGALAGFIGSRFTDIFERINGQFILQIIAGIILIMLGMHIAGWMPRLKQLETLGTGVWRYLQPLGKRFLPVTNMTRALFIGVIWGWLPCGLVYSILLLAITSGSPVQGAIYLFLFGMGTLPSMFMAGIAGGLLRQYLQNSSIRQIAGLLIIISGMIIPLIQGNYLHNKHNPDIHQIGMEKILQ
jgi:sulfite exporter TauE/SafE